MKMLSLSICTYSDGKFDVILRDPDTLREVTLSGQQDIGEEDFNFLNDVAPACVFTKYARVTPED